MGETNVIPWAIQSQANLEAPTIGHTPKTHPKTQLYQDINQHNKNTNFNYTPQPGTGYRASRLLDPDSPCVELLRTSYASAMNLVYGRGQLLGTARNPSRPAQHSYTQQRCRDSPRPPSSAARSNALTAIQQSQKPVQPKTNDAHQTHNNAL